MTTKKRTWFVTLLIIVLLAIAATILHILRNQPFSTMGYWIQTSAVLQDKVSHFDRNGMLEVEFHYKSFGYGTKETYSLRRVGDPKPILDSVSMGIESVTKGWWDMYRFPIAHYPNALHLGVGKYIVTFYLNGEAVVCHIFYVDKPVVIQAG